MLSFEGFIVFGVCHARLEANGNATVTLIHSQSHAANNVGCLCHRNGSIWFLLPSKYSSPFQLLVARKFNFNATEMLCKYFKVLDGVLTSDSRLGLQGNLYASMLFGSDTVSELLLVSEHMCQLLGSVAPEVSDIEDNGIGAISTHSIPIAPMR
ncbi:uncharacterized protein LOC113214382 [Frankliniella occidentalis]|uniref:Uncharacterized protein LOC113214382 n=1 Tax=Frankliniella occidentalis TaxID=133901 RepID=A0A6J1T897_FRAOC|nr:uncharacterized protein LOC113214382 [Frankliniella occidentalis]